MKRLRHWSLSLGALVFGALVAADDAAAANPQNSVSDSYFTLNVVEGSIDVHVKTTIQNMTTKPMTEVVIWALAGAENVVVTRDGRDLATTVSAAPGQQLTAVTAKFDTAIKPKGRADFEMTYHAGARSSEGTRIAPGVIALPFVSQGDGSFVFVDVPVDADNYFEPGCLKASVQPKEVTGKGRERWVCGDAALISLSSEDPAVQKKCAALDSSCRQKILDVPFSAYAQSITDRSMLGRLEADVPMARGPVKVSLSYFHADAAWASTQFETAKAAMPLLEALFGFPYDRPTLSLKQSYNLEFSGAAGVAFTTMGVVLVSKSGGVFDDREVTVHELAHQWAGHQLESPWLWEGLAEFATTVVAPQLGVKLYERNWNSRVSGLGPPLSTWGSSLGSGDPNFWYGKAEAFWHAYEAAIGGRENMANVLSRIDDEPDRHPLDAKWFMNQGEWISGATLEALFLTWVFNPDTAAPLLKERRAANDQVQTLIVRANSMGLSGFPKDILANLDAWTFKGIPDQVKEGNKVLDQYQIAIDAGAAAGLPPVEAVATSWWQGTLAQTNGVIQNQRQAIAGIVGARASVDALPADSPSRAVLEGAVEKYAAGDFGAAEDQAAQSVRAIISADTAVKLIAATRAVEKSFSPNLFEKVGLIGKNPGAKLDEAERALAAGDVSTALKKAESAYSTWDDAQVSGFVRLAILTGLMSVASLGALWVVKRMEAQQLPAKTTAGFELGDASERKHSWRDYENTGESGPH